MNKIKLGLFLLVIFSNCFSSNASVAISDKQAMAIMRQIGHEVLLASGDSVSRVLPIVKTFDGYEIKLATRFELTPSVLVLKVEEALRETNLAESYIVEVIDNATREVVYSYKMDKQTKKETIPCRSRTLPQSFYNIVFTILDKPVNTADEVEAEQNTAGKTMYYAMAVPLITVLVFLGFFYSRKKESSSNTLGLGGYLFNPIEGVLIFEGESEQLSEKENALLQLLMEHMNDVVNKEEILSVVWGDEGNYVGRTLDVYISKLRKKLESDSNLKIVNARGIGYKLVIQET